MKSFGNKELLSVIVDQSVPLGKYAMLCLLMLKIIAHLLLILQNWSVLRIFVQMIVECGVIMVFVSQSYHGIMMRPK